MFPQREKIVLARVTPDMFVGRADAVERLYLRALSGPGRDLVRVSGAPGVGTSEVLRNVYDRLFLDQRFVIPFYFSLRAADRTVLSAATRFVYEFLLQAVAFRRNDPLLIASSPDVCELQKLAPLADADWVRSLCETCDIAGLLNDDRATVRSALSAPFRAAARARARVCVIIDDVHESILLDGGQDLIDQIVSNFGSVDCAVIVGSRRTFEVRGQAGGVFAIEPLTAEDAGSLVETVAAEAGIRVSEPVRDLMSAHLERNPALITEFLRGIGDKATNLLSYRDVAIGYTDELGSGQMAAHCGQIFERAAPDAGHRREIMNSLSSMVGHGQTSFSLEALRDRIGISNEDFARTVDSLSIDEVIAVSGTSARLSAGNVVQDYLHLQSMVDAFGGSEPAARAGMVTRFLRQAPERMARDHRRRASVGLQSVLMMFDMQAVPRALLDYRMFRDRYVGLADAEIRLQIPDDQDRFDLPQIGHAGPLAEHLPNFASSIEPERAIVSSGFTDRSYREDDEIAWFAAEIDSKLEADPEITREWIERLSAAAAELGHRRSRIWLVAPEGFSPGSLELLSEHNAFGSSRRQVELLRELLRGPINVADAGLKEYELTVPVGEDSELIAVHALEEIARRYDFPAKSVNQVKTALVEASINAAEHGLAPDRRIHQKFGVYPDRIVVTVSNRGLRLADKMRSTDIEEPDASGTRRGWGLGLIRTLMDEVRIESVDDGTRIVMIKHMKTAA